jgi:3-phenylpropionate/trans-cinnamate dioxygenase ferredoxin reductase component
MPDAVIVGAGQAGAQAAASLRQEGFEGSILLLGEEIWPPYQRPPLSKKFLSGELDEERLYLRPEAFYAQSGIETRWGARAVSLDRAAKTVTLADGGTVAYGRLILSTGTRVRKLPVPGADLPGVHYLRGIDDVRALRADFRPGARLVIAGAGYIGLEVAAVAVKAGLDVTVAEMAPRCLARVTSPVMSAFFHDVHTAAGVKLRYNAGLEAIDGAARVERVTAGGETLPADAVLIGAGVLPNVELAQEAGLAVDNGIVVDEHGASSDAAIYAAGDCTNHPNALLGRRLRLESVQNAIDQAKAVAAAIAGKPKPYAEVPWFWSDQYDLKLQMAGLSAAGDTVILRGDPASRKFAAFYLHDGKLAAVDAVNAAPEYMTGRMMIAKGLAPDPARLADPSVPMKALMG